MLRTSATAKMDALIATNEEAGAAPNATKTRGLATQKAKEYFESFDAEGSGYIVELLNKDTLGQGVLSFIERFPLFGG